MSPYFRLAGTPCLRFPWGKHDMPLTRMESPYNRNGVKVSITPDFALLSDLKMPVHSIQHLLCHLGNRDAHRDHFAWSLSVCT